MIELIPLCSAVVEVAPSMAVGTVAGGERSVGELRSVIISGERMQASLAGVAAADWMVRAGDYGIIDVRLTVRTQDDALIYVSYGGRLDLSNPAAGIFAYVAPVFETGDPRYAWLNRLQAVGKGKLAIAADGSARLDYEFFEIR